MILLRFDTDEIENCKNVTDVFRVMGVGVAGDDSVGLHFDEPKVFGKKANYKNMIISEHTYNQVAKHFEGTPYAGTWWDIAPITERNAPVGVLDAMGGLVDGILYIITPEDEYYTEVKGE